MIYKSYQFDEITLMDDLVKLLEERRKALGWSVKHLAEQADIDYIVVIGILEDSFFLDEPIIRLITVVENALKAKQIQNKFPPLNNALKRLKPLSDIKGKKSRWSLKFDKCLKCGTTEVKHRARGLCIKCYNNYNERRHKIHKRKRGTASNILTKEYLVEQYLNNEKSLSDIAKECSCSRQHVHKKMKFYQIPLRNKSHARNLALEKDKLLFERVDEYGEKYSLSLQKIECNENFFSSWSPEMAWVLGVIYADGNLFYNKILKHARLSINQKEPEVLNKIKALMKCNAKLYFSPRKRYKSKNKIIVSGERYSLQINNQKIYNDLIKLGLKPNKSLDVKFPQIPREYVRHFIRGCWDGDGSFTQSKASYVSGSFNFITGMLSELGKIGLPKMKIEQYKSSNSYSFYYSRSYYTILYHYLYDNVSPELYLKRKYDALRKYL